MKLCDLLRPRLIAEGHYLASVDLLGGKVLSVDVFTPRGLHALTEVHGVDMADLVIRDVERRVRLRDAYQRSVDPDTGRLI